VGSAVGVSCGPRGTSCTVVKCEGIVWTARDFLYCSKDWLATVVGLAVLVVVGRSLAGAYQRPIQWAM
jgi:hypothetical protein